MHVHDLVPYLQGGNKHDFGHHIHEFYFTSEEGETEDSTRIRNELGFVNPLNGVRAHTEESN
jgi:endoplasmic reticulum-Golgi intermediate compartment protein 3